MTKYSRKPVVVEVVKWEGDFFVNGKDTEPSFVNESLEEETLFFGNQGKLYVVTPGTPHMLCPVGCHIIKDDQGEVYLCEPDVFAQTFEEVCDA